jgi:hypothetical protein
VQIREDQSPILHPRFGLVRDFIPTAADISAGKLNAHQQRGGIGNIAEVIGLFAANFAIIKCERLVSLTVLEVEQGEMPEQVSNIGVVRRQAEWDKLGASVREALLHLG